MIDWNAIENLWAPVQRGEYEGLLEVVRRVKAGEADEQSVAVLCSMLSSDEGNVECSAASTLDGVSKQAQAWLGAWLNSGHSEEAKFAAHALYRWVMWPERDPALLMQALPYLEGIERRDLVDFLRGSTLVTEAFARWVEALRNGRDPWAIPDVPGQFGDSTPAPEFTQIAALLAEGGATDAEAVIELLGKLGPSAREAAPAVTAMLRGEVPECWAVPKALASILGVAAVPLLTEVFVDEFFRCEDWALTRTFAADALGELGPGAKDAVPVLRAALQDPNASVRESAAAALLDIDAQAAAAEGIR